MRPEQAAGAVLMVRPVHFCANPETASTNEFQSPAPGGDLERAQREFDGLVRALSDHGVGVVVVDDTDEPHTPDAIFPNNWVSTHRDGTVVTYPMQAHSRRGERRADIHDVFARHGYEVSRHIDLAGFEERDLFLEGTGSLVLDRVNRVAFACLSPRTSREVVEDFAGHLGYETVLFEAYGATGKAIYHTNVMMCVGTSVAVVCVEAVDPDHRDALLERLAPGRSVVPITREQMWRFAGNMLELKAGDGERLLVMSSQARESLNNDQLSELARHVRLVDAPIPSIEEASGGSVRCKMAEIFLPKREQP